MQLGFVTFQEDNEQSNDINVSREIAYKICKAALSKVVFVFI
jgi:hypothetical protein